MNFSCGNYHHSVAFWLNSATLSKPTKTTGFSCYQLSQWKTAPRATPAAETLFDVSSDVEKASSSEAAYFHTYVAKILYLAKRVRPECLTAVSFLTTRVHDCDIKSMAKLKLLLGYLPGTRDRGTHDCTNIHRCSIRIAHFKRKAHTGWCAIL